MTAASSSRSAAAVWLRFALVALLVCLAAAVVTSASEETVTYFGQLRLPEAYLRHPDSQNPLNNIQQGSVLLTNGHGTIMVPTARDGSFIAYKLPYGTYLMQADYHDFEFPTMRVDVMYRETSSGAHEPLIRTSTNDFPVKQVEGTGLEEESPALIPVSGMHQYYVPRQEMRLTDLVKNPMIMMLLISCGLMGLMKLFPEEEVKESQKMSREWQKKLAAKVAAAAEKPGAAKK
ncbi:putative mitochondrial hypothetical protein [Leptomonas pyrrhocoris]|uniref:ER membrane protein complex subunit 7 beta-sandwich domain-containing protein n=1 Tax=Leptomonas pyrrhocoris TaxID=157538 RepID=A0A0M9GBK2_LEPPY|nr:putative mitochondrial hypothetical protein [Leptomonas pyrrhocoris]KPA86786.1 putative mitochondrial hypothetical protein [Leptomonas pyrrhocoris]|eukprot:XP_015665225.1 putative mitochondrial hypothetical protein [Leptomonas pyrrhocoris]